MLLRVIAVMLLMFAVVGFCFENTTNEVLVEEARADKKKRKNKLRLWGLLLILVFAKLAVTKVASMFFAYGAFQKILLLIGMFINYFMTAEPTTFRPATEMTSPPPAPSPVDYNTIGYSYGPPDTDGIGTPLPPDTSYGVPYNTWPYKRSLDTK